MPCIKMYIYKYCIEIRSISSNKKYYDNCKHFRHKFID